MLSRVARYIATYHLLEPREKVLVAVSGGADSVALLDVLCRLGFACEVAHCNFHLRGEESMRDEQFVRALCESMGVECTVKDFDTLAYASSKGISTEMAARDLRYAWFEQLRVARGCGKIAVAHHQNDQAETLLLNLQRGTGLRGLEGMHPRNGYVVRPLLCTNREAIVDYLTLRGLQHVEDSSNADTHFQRNAIRQQLAAYSSAQIGHLADTCALMQGYEAVVNAYVDAVRERVMSETTIRGTHTLVQRLHIPTLLAYPAAHILLYELLREYGFTQCDQVYESVVRGESGRRFYSDNWQIVTDREYLLITENGEYEEDTPRLQIDIRKVRERESYFPADSFSCLLDGRVGQKKLTLRHWREGDWFVPLGMRGKKKLQDFFTDQHLSVLEKERVWLLCADEDIVWVVGYRIDDRYKVTAQSEMVAHVALG